MRNIHLMLQAECTLLFEQNPYLLETVDGLAERLGRDAEVLQPVLQQLVQLSILDQLSSGEHLLYRYNQPDIVNVG